MAIIGCFFVLAGLLSYLCMLFVFHRFTYQTWIFDVVVGAGMVMEALSWFQRGGNWLSWGTILLGVIWFLVSRAELRIVGSKELNLREGDKVPAMAFLKTNGVQFTEQDLIANAPALLTLYRGWWCPTNKTQLNEVLENYENLRKRGVSIYAASVDEPAMAESIQEYVGDHITILCSASEAVLGKIGVIDKRGAPWYDRLIFGAPKRPIAMPSTLVIDKDGKIIFVSRSTRVDDRPRADAILASLSLLP